MKLSSRHSNVSADNSPPVVSLIAIALVKERCILGIVMRTNIHFLLLSIVFLCLMPYAAFGQDEDEIETDEPDYIQEIEEYYGLVDDPEITSLVEGIRDRLVDAIPEDESGELEIVVKVLDDDSINAFAMPEGNVYFFLGLIEACETEDMLAGVMAHEFTHVVHKHHRGLAERQLRGMIIGIAALIASGEIEGMLLGQMVSASMTETYGRSAEIDADTNGVRLMVDAGYDPIGYFELLQVLEQLSIHRPEPGGNYFTVHPHPDERIAVVMETLTDMGIEIPEVIYRVHLPLVMYLPLTDSESDRLADWEQALIERAESGDEEDDEVDTDADEDDSDADEIPPSLLSEYRLRQDLFSGIIEPDRGVYGVIAVGDEGVFYISAEDDESLRSRAEEIISRLGGLFQDGLRDYEVRGDTGPESPVLKARRREIASVTETDAALLGPTVEEVNSERVRILKDVLYFYYVNRRI